MKIEFDTLKNQINKSANILILTHNSPDGDAIGSSISLKLLLTKMGKKADCVLDENMPKQFSFFEEYFIISKEVTNEYDLVVFVDCASKDRTAVSYNFATPTCIIDHHISNKKDGDINIVDPDACSTGEIMYYLYKEYDIPLCEHSAQAIYNAIFCDTGSFMFSNTNRQTHLIVADLLVYNFDKDIIARKAYMEKSLTYSKLYSHIFSNMTMLNHAEVAIACIDFDTYIALGATNDDTDGLSNAVRNIIGVDCGILLTEKEKGIIKGSIRTNEGYDANQIAQMFDGGGHVRAAGFRTTLTIKEIKEKINEWVSINK
jgi:phosphoesterase RecJ-like protein